jgi:hypothetical protein
MSASEGYIPVTDAAGRPRGLLRLEESGWIYYASEALLLRTPIGDPMRTGVIDSGVIGSFFPGASFDGFAVVLP